MKELLIVAGPNGSGKTTYAEEFLTEHAIPYLSADLIAAQLAPADPSRERVAAGREFLSRIEAGLGGSDSFLVESTLSGRLFHRFLERARASGFEVTILFVYLNSADACVARVKERFRKGGQNVAEPDVRRRYSRSLANFWQMYRQIADRWLMVYNGGNEFQTVAIGNGDGISIRDEMLFRQFFELAGLDIDA